MVSIPRRHSFGKLITGPCWHNKKTPISSSQALKEMLPKLPAITENLCDRKVELMGFARSLEPMELSLLAREVKKLTGCWIAAFLKDVKNSCESIGSENKCPEMYFDGAKYYRPRNDSYDSIIREDKSLELRKFRFSGNIPDGALISPLEKTLHHIPDRKSCSLCRGNMWQASWRT